MRLGNAAPRVAAADAQAAAKELAAAEKALQQAEDELRQARGNRCAGLNVSAGASGRQYYCASSLYTCGYQALMWCGCTYCQQ